MTTLAPTLSASRSNEAARRVFAVIKLHFVNRFQILYLPLIVLGAIFLVNLAIWWIIVESTGGNNSSNRSATHLGYSGAVSYIYVYGIVIAVQAISRTFPFSLGFGVTRRDFYVGSALAFVLLSFGFAVVLTIMSVLEIATNGWGLGGRMFAPLFFTNSFWLLRFVMYFCAFLFLLFIGTAGAAFYVRWKATGLTVFFAIIAIVILAAIAYFTLGHHWDVVGKWIDSSGPVGITVWLLLPAAVFAIAGFFVLRRATPKN
jgi:hypothetical protein